MKITVIYGDGIGKEIIPCALKVLDQVCKGRIKYEIVEAGYGAYAKLGTNLPEETIEAIRRYKICLAGPMQTPLDKKEFKSTIVAIRKMFDLYANIRPAKSFSNISLRDLDLIIVRENTEDLYSGIEWRLGDYAFTLRVISKEKSLKVAEKAFELAKMRRGKVTVVTKSNIMRETCGLFKQAAFEVARQYPDVCVEEVLVDAMSMKLIKEPDKYDVLLCPNLFGDILSDEVAGLVGSLGILPSANIGDEYALFQPVHGTAPDIAGKGIANPTAAILSAKMLLEYIGMIKEAKKIENAIEKVFSKRLFTRDLGGSLTTEKFTEKVIKFLEQ